MPYYNPNAPLLPGRSDSGSRFLSPAGTPNTSGKGFPKKRRTGFLGTGIGPDIGLGAKRLADEIGQGASGLFGILLHPSRADIIPRGIGSALSTLALDVAEPVVEGAQLLAPGSKSGERGWLSDGKTRSSVAGAREAAGRFLGGSPEEEAALTPVSIEESLDTRGLLPTLVERVGNLSLAGSTVTGTVKGAEILSRVARATETAGKLRAVHAGLVTQPGMLAIQRPYLTAGKSLRENVIAPAAARDLAAFRAANEVPKPSLPIHVSGGGTPDAPTLRFEAREGKAPAGSLDVRVDPATKTATVEGIVTLPGHKRQGVATSLLDEVYTKLGEDHDIAFTSLEPEGAKFIAGYMQKHPDRIDPASLVTSDGQAFKPPPAPRLPGAAGSRTTTLLAGIEHRLQAWDTGKSAREQARLAEMERKIAARSPGIRASIAAEIYLRDAAEAAGIPMTRKEITLAVGDEVRARATGVKAVEDKYLERGLPKDLVIKAGSIRDRFIPDALAGDPGLQAALADATAEYVAAHGAVREVLESSRKGSKGLEGADALVAEPTPSQVRAIRDADRLMAKADSEIQAGKIRRERRRLEKYAGALEDTIGRAGNEALRLAQDSGAALEAFDHSRKWVPAAWKGEGALTRSAGEIHQAALRDIEANGGEWGGVTFNPHTNRYLVAGEDPGIVVGAVPGTAIAVPLDEFQANGAAYIEQAVTAFEDVYQFADTTIGVWLGDGGIVHIDPGQVIDDLGEALILGAARDQISLFDLPNKREVPGLFRDDPDLALPYLKKRGGFDRVVKNLEDLARKGVIEGSDIPQILDENARVAARWARLGKVRHPDDYMAGLSFKAKAGEPAGALHPEGISRKVSKKIPAGADPTIPRDPAPLADIPTYGTRSLEAMFPEGGLTAVVPWKQAGGQKAVQGFDQDLVNEVLAQPDPPVQDVDPRGLLATQPKVTRGGVDHYLSGKPGAFADAGVVSNQVPVVYRRPKWTDATVSEDVLLAGHHRAAAALLRGEPLHAIVIEGPWGKPRGSAALTKVPETGTIKQRAANAPKFPEPPATSQDLYAAGRKGRQAIAKIEVLAKRQKSLAGVVSRAERDLEGVRTVLAEGRLPSELERDAMKAKAGRNLEKVQKQLAWPSESQAPARLQPLYRAVEDLGRLAGKHPGYAEILSDLPQSLDEVLRLATEAGFDPTHVSEFSNTKVRRLVFGSMRLGLGRGVAHEAEASARKARSGTMARAGGIDRSVEALLAGTVEAIIEKRTNMVVDGIDRIGQKIEHGTPIPPGYSAWDPARTFLLTGTRLSDDALRSVDTAAGPVTIVPTAVLTTLDRYTKDYTHPAFEKLNKITSPWRTLVLTLSPAWYARNTVTNAILATAEGANVQDWVKAWKSYRSTDEIGHFADLPFISGSTLAQEGAAGVDPNLLPQRGIREAVAEGGKIRGGASYASRSLLRVNEVVDEFARAAVYHQGRRLNMTPEQAWKKAQHALVDYNNLSPFERSAVRSVIPFYAWQKGILKVTMNQVLEHPARASITMLLGRIQDEYIADRFGLDKEDVPGLYKHLVGSVNVRSYNPFADPADLTSVEGLARSLNPFLELSLRKGLGASEFYSDQKRLSFFGNPEDDVDVLKELGEMVTRSPGGRIISTGPGTNLLGVSTVDDAALRSRFLKARRQIRGIPNPETRPAAGGGTGYYSQAG